MTTTTFGIYEFKSGRAVGTASTEEAATKDCIARYLESDKRHSFFYKKL